MGWVDSSTDRSVPFAEGLISRRLCPQNKWRTYEPTNSLKLDAQLRFALHRAQHGLPRGLLLNLGRIVDRDARINSQSPANRAKYHDGAYPEAAPPGMPLNPPHRSSIRSLFGSSSIGMN
jgi:hypothetical protein